MAKKKSKKAPRSLYVIAQEIHHTWPNVYYGAVPYLSAMGQMATMQDMYGVEDAKGIVLYFLSNATSWRGPDAKRIKAELNAMVKAARSGNPRGAPQWNPVEYEDYNVTIYPSASDALGKSARDSWRAADKVLKSLHIWVDESDGVKFRADGLNFDRFRDLIAALEYRGFKGNVDVDGQVRIEYEGEVKKRRQVKGARTKLRKARQGGGKVAILAARRVLGRAMRGT